MTRRGARWAIAAVVLAAVTACSDSATDPVSPTAAVTSASAASTPERLRAEVIAKRPHDASAFTQGLVFAGAKLFESTGLKGQSTLREVDPRTGAVLRRTALGPEFFGEGLAAVDDRLIWLTWREKTAFVYRQDSFEQIGMFSYDTEGWGLCYDGRRLVMSDGSDKLYFRDPVNFALLSSISVRRGTEPVAQLNELECVDGAVYANIWETSTIVRIDPATGAVTATIDAAGLLTADEAREANVLNGIAYDRSTMTFLITGKNWPSMFEVRFVP